MPTEVTSDPTFQSSMMATALAPLGAVRDAAQGAIDTVKDAPSPFAPLDRMMGTQRPKFPEGSLELPEVPRADESTGYGQAVNAARDIGRFIVGFLGAGTVLKGLGMAEGVGTAIASGGIGDFLVTGAHDQRLVDFFDTVPALKGPVLDALAEAGSGEGDSWVRKIEAAGEGVLAGAAIEGVVKLVGGLRKVVQAQLTGDAEAVKKAVTEAEPELQQGLDAVTKEHPEGEPLAKSPTPPEEPDNVEVKTNGDSFEHPDNGDTPLPLSDNAKSEIKAASEGGDVHFDKLSPETQAEVKAWLEKNPDLVPPAPKPKYEPAFKLDDAQKADFEKALETSLSVPYATLKAEAPGSALEDTLGNYFNYRRMDSPDAVKLSLSQLAEMMAPKIDEVSGGAKQTFARVQELADWVGSKPDVLMGSLQQLTGQSENMPALVVAGKTWMQSLTNDILKIAKMDAAGLATDADKVYMDQMTNVLMDLVGTVKSVQRAAARTTAAGRIATGSGLEAADAATLRGQLGDKNFKLIGNLLGLTDGNPGSVIKLLEPTLGQKIMGVANEFWINSVLSGWPTQVVNLAGNVRNTFLYPLYRMAGGALTADKQALQVGMAQYAALRSHVFDSFEMARRALVSNAPVLDAAGQQVEAHPGWIRAGTFGLQDDNIFGVGVNWLGKAIGMPTRFLTASDEFFAQLNYRASVEARARTEAFRTGLSDKPSIPVSIDGKVKLVSPVDQYVKDAFEEAFNPANGSAFGAEGELLNSAAMADSRRARFTQPLKQDANWFGATKSLGEIVNGAANSMPWFRHVVAPFTKVPTNLFREMMYESPAAPLRAQFWHDVQQGGERRADAIGRLSLGSMFSAGVSMLVAEGVITGKGPTDPQLNKQWRAAGNQPYSIRLRGAGENGQDLFIPYQRFDPVAGIMGIIADASYIMAHVDERTQNSLAMSIGLSLAANLNAKGYLQSMTDLMGVLRSSQQADGPSTVQSFLNSRAASYIPRAISSFNTDDTLHQVRGMIDAIENRIPGLASKLDPMRDNLGDKMTTPVGWPWREINPFSLVEGKTSPARSEMAYWGEGPTKTRFMMPSPSVGGAIDLRDFKNPRTGQSAYDRWMELVSNPGGNRKSAEESINALVSSDAYKNAKKNGVEDPIYRQHPAAQMIKDELQRHYEAAHTQMLSEPGFENLRGALAQFSAAQRAVPLGAPTPTNPTLQDLLNNK
ncbi:hypothetical protein [Enhydrobacter aerosaccus]|nr:hypothetical protein [Enhydrobacter aerosaccus]